MEKLHKQALQKLLSTNPGLAVTMYVPMHTTASPPHISENQIRFKNLAHKAIDELKASRSYELADELTNKVNELHDNLTFWKEQTPGMLICASPGKIAMYHLPVDTEEYVSIDKFFHLAPLLGLIFNDEREFYVLELAEHNPQLLKGDMYSLEPTKVNMPTNIREAITSFEKTHKPGHDHSRSNSYSFTTGYPSRFFRIIDSVIYGSTDHTLPLILAGTETEIAEYREISRYPKILKSSVSNSYNRAHIKDLYLRAKEIIRIELVQPAHLLAVEEYERLEQTDPQKVACDEKAIFKAAEQGRIDKLFTNMSQQTTDNVQDSLAPVTRITFLEPRLNSFLSKLTLKVWQMKGLVLNLLPNEMPHADPVVAKLRY